MCHSCVACNQPIRLPLLCCSFAGLQGQQHKVTSQADCQACANALLSSLAHDQSFAIPSCNMVQQQAAQMALTTTVSFPCEYCSQSDACPLPCSAQSCCRSTKGCSKTSRTHFDTEGSWLVEEPPWVEEPPRLVCMRVCLLKSCIESTTPPRSCESPNARAPLAKVSLSRRDMTLPLGSPLQQAAHALGIHEGELSDSDI